MSFFPGRLTFKHLAVFAFVFGLAGCGVADSVGSAVADGIGKGLGCALSSGFNAYGHGLEVHLEQARYDELGEFIRKNGIGDEGALYARLDPKAAAFLKRQMGDAYAALPEKDSLRGAPVAFYENLYGFGLVSAAKDNLPLGQIDFTAEISQKKGDTISYDSYRIRLTIDNARSKEGKTYSLCK